MADGGTDWGNDRMETTYEEARAVIESQNVTMADIDTKAMQTVRFDALLIGLLLTAAQFDTTTGLTGPETFTPELFFLSIVSLLCSVTLGVITYNESHLFEGVSGSYVEHLAEATTEDDRWDRDVLRTFAGMLSENADEIAWNSWLLTLTQAALVLGVLSAVGSVLNRSAHPRDSHECREPGESEGERAAEWEGTAVAFQAPRSHRRRERLTRPATGGVASSD